MDNRKNQDDLHSTIKIESPSKKRNSEKALHKEPFLFVIIKGGFAHWYPVKGDEITFGRDYTNSIQIDNPDISRNHARIIVKGEEYLLEDLSSTNGTFLNGLQITQHKLQDGDKINLADSATILFESKEKMDITAYENLYESALHDQLTGIYNRHYFLNEVKKEFEFCKRYASSLSLIFFDIDKFKSYNDNYGHLFGDKILKTITKTISNKIRASDVFARFGGEEFIIIFRNALPAEASIFAEKIRSIVENISFTAPNNDSLKITISLGVITNENPQQYKSFDEMLDVVDKRLYQAKSKGRNQTVIDEQGHSEKRKYPRYPFLAVIKILDVPGDYPLEALNISIGGVRLRGDAVLLEKLTLNTDITIHFLEEPLIMKCRGNIVRINDDTNKGFRYCAVAFKDLEQGQVDMLQNAINQIRKKLS
ncbi:MAG: diguanylate cyclase [bacterium]